MGACTNILTLAPTLSCLYQVLLVKKSITLFLTLLFNTIKPSRHNLSNRTMQKRIRSCHKSMMELFGKVATGFWPLFMFTKCSYTDVWLGPKWTGSYMIRAYVMKELIPKHFITLFERQFYLTHSLPIFPFISTLFIIANVQYICHLIGRG